MRQNPGITIFADRYNDIPGLTMGMSLTKSKLFLIKSISQTTGNANSTTEQTFITLTIIILFQSTVMSVVMLHL